MATSQAQPKTVAMEELQAAEAVEAVVEPPLAVTAEQAEEVKSESTPGSKDACHHHEDHMGNPWRQRLLLL
jgi:hypothetical protein